MKKIVCVVGILVLCALMVFPMISDAKKRSVPSGKTTERLNVQGWDVLIRLYNGRLGSAKVFITCDGNFNHDKDFIPGFAVRVSYELPSGDRKENEDWFPHQYSDTGRFKMHNEFVVYLVGDEDGTGTLSIEVDGEEVLFTEYEAEGDYIRFGS